MYVLVVENETPILKQMRAALEGSTVPISLASSRDEALRIVDEAGTPAILVTNVDLGQRLDGFSLAHKLRRSSPLMLTLFVSATRWDVVRGVVGKQDPFMLKPFDAAVFAEKPGDILQQTVASSIPFKQA